MPGISNQKTATGRWAFSVLLLGLAAALFYFASSFMHALMLGLFVAIVVQPIQTFISRGLPPVSHRKKKEHHHSCFYFLPFGVLRSPLRMLRRKYPAESRNPISLLCDLLTDSKVETCRAAIEKRRLLVTLLTVAVLVIGIAIPVTLFLHSATVQCYAAIEVCTEHVSSGKISQDLLELYRKPALRKLYHAVEENKVGHFVLVKINDYFSSPGWKKPIDQFFASLQEKERLMNQTPSAASGEGASAEDREDTADEQTGAASLGAAGMDEKLPVSEESSEAVEENSENDAREIWTEEGQPHLLIFDKLEPYLGKLGKYLLGWLKNGSLQLLSFTGALAFQLLIFLVTFFFAIHRGRYLYNFFLRVSPFDYDDLRTISTKVADTSMTILWGSISGVVVQGIIAMVGFKIVGLPAFFLGLLCMVCAVVPFVGTALVWGPTALYLWLGGHPGQALFIVVCGVIIGNVDGIVRPWVMSHWHNSNLSFAILFFTLLGGLRSCGFIGLIYAPIVASVFITAIEIFSVKYKHQQIGTQEHG